MGQRPRRQISGQEHVSGTHFYRCASITTLVLTETIVIHAMGEMLDERSRRNAAVGTYRFNKQRPSQPMSHSQTQDHTSSAAQGSNSATNTAPPPGATNTNRQEDRLKPTEKKPESRAEPEDPLDSIFEAKRDPGVSDEVWEQLERDKHAMVAKEREFRRMQEEKRQYEEHIKEFIRAEKAAADEEERRVREQARIAAELERRRRDEELAAIEKERQREMDRQKKLKVLGPCPMGYQWIKQASGYRCAGGSHTLSNASIDAFCR
jgi:hypothetical protein